MCNTIWYTPRDQLRRSVFSFDALRFGVAQHGPISPITCLAQTAGEVDVDDRPRHKIHRPEHLVSLVVETTFWVAVEFPDMLHILLPFLLYPV